MLQLTIVEAPERETPEGTTHVVGPAGATIGRTQDNTWVLSDEQSLLSRSHCRIQFEAGVYLLEDTSTNGSFLNDAAEPVGRGNRAALQEGDTIRLGGYQLAVSIEPLGQRPPPFESQPPAFLVPGDKNEKHQPEASGFGADPAAFVEPAPHEQPGAFADVTPQPLSDSLFGNGTPGRAASADGLAGPEPGAGISPASTPGAMAGEAGDNSPLGAPSGLFSSSGSRGSSGMSSDHDKGAAGNGGFSLQVPVAESPPDTPSVAVPAAGTGAEDAIIPDDWWLEADHPEDAPEAAPPASPAAPVPPATPVPPPAAIAPAVAQPPLARPGGAADAVGPPGGANFSTPTPGQDGQSAEVETRLRQVLTQALGNHARMLPLNDLLRVVEELTAMASLSAPRLMQALNSRTQFKDQLRLDQTMVRARDNNPLKFCDSAEEALQHMLLNDHPGLLQGRFAIEEAFKELATHQTALVGALQPALQETISQFAPEAVEAATESDGVGGFALSKGKGKLWDSYREIYARLSDPERGMLERRFMTALAQHYERKLKALP